LIWVISNLAQAEAVLEVEQGILDVPLEVDRELRRIF